MSSEKTLNEKEIRAKATRQALTFSAKVSMGLSAANVSPELMEFYINNSQAVNNCCEIFAREPLNITVVGSRGNPAMSAAAYLEMYYPKMSNAYFIHRQLTEDTRITVLLPAWVDVMIFDVSFLHDVSETITRWISSEKCTESKFKMAIGIGTAAPRPLGYKGMVFFGTWKEAVLHLIDWQFKRLRDELSLGLIA